MLVTLGDGPLPGILGISGRAPRIPGLGRCRPMGTADVGRVVACGRWKGADVDVGEESELAETGEAELAVGAGGDGCERDQGVVVERLERFELLAVTTAQTVEAST